MKVTDDMVTAWVDNSRQWGRALNVQHAKYRLRTAQTKEDALFWGLVLARYTY